LQKVGHYYAPLSSTVRRRGVGASGSEEVRAGKVSAEVGVVALVGAVHSVAQAV
jgi:hypothetical protein